MMDGEFLQVANEQRVVQGRGSRVEICDHLQMGQLLLEYRYDDELAA